MTSSLIACAYVCVMIVVAWGFTRVAFPQYADEVNRVCFAWLLISLLIFIAPHGTLYVLGFGLVVVTLTPKTGAGRMMFVIAVMTSTPMFIGWDVPFPGINYLIRLDTQTLLNLFVLLPFLLAPQSTEKPLAEQTREARKILLFVALFAIVETLLEFRAATLTHALRLLIMQSITYALLLLAFWRAIGEEGVPEKMILGFLLGGILLLFVGLAQDYKTWNFYASTANSLRVGSIGYQTLAVMRDGELRISSTMLSPIPFGMYMALCMGIAMYYLSKRSVSGILGIVMIALFTYGVYRSQTRGAWLMAVLIVGYWIYYARPMQTFRILMATAMVAFLIAVFTTPLGDAIVEMDEHGTLQYRIDLITNSMDTIQTHPFFGTIDPGSNEDLQASLQGQGIIDLTNTYLLITVYRGFIGLAVMVIPLWLSLRGMRRRRTECEISDAIEEERLARAAAVITIGFGIGLLNVSPIDRIWDIYWYLVLIGAALTVRSAIGSPAKPKFRKITIRQPSSA